MPITDWTPAGIRLTSALTNSMIVFTCESQALLPHEGTSRRLIWTLSQLVIPSGTPRTEAERILRHWLSFYGGEALIANGTDLFEATFTSCALVDSQTAPAPAKLDS